MSGEVRCWYLSQKGKAAGPFAFSDLKSMAAQGSLKGHDLVFREGSTEWKRAYDWPELVRECFSDENRSSLSRLIKLPEEERAVEDQWVLLVREDGEKEVRFRQKGPFQTDEIRRMLVEEKIKPSDHIWKKGAARWVPLYDAPEFRVHDLKMTKAAEAALSQVDSMPELAQADPLAAMMPATPDQAKSPDLVVLGKAQVFSPEVTQTGLTLKTPESEEPAADDLTPAPILSVNGVERAPMPIFSMGVVVPDEVFEVEPAASVDETPVEATGGTLAIIAPEEKVAPPPEVPAVAAKAPLAQALTPPAAQPNAQPVSQPVARPAVRSRAKAKPAAPSAESAYDVEPAKTFFGRASPFLGVMIIAIFGVGVWATLNTDKSVFQSGSSASQAPMAMPPPNELPAVEPAEAPTLAKLPVKPAPAVPSNVTVEEEVPEAAQEAPAPASAATAAQGSDFDGKNPLVRINAQNSFLEIMGPFRKGELLRIRIEGRAGQILDLPALVQKYEVRAGQDHSYRVSLKDARIPKGEYLVSVQFGMNRFSRGVGYGKDAGFREALQNHRKSISYDQQRERKLLLAATKDFGKLLAKAETAAKNSGTIKKLQLELEKKTPRELRLVRTNRYELFFFDYWEKLAAQWERIQVTMKDNPGRNPASVGEYARARKTLTSLENEIRATSIWN